jgi:DNA-binding transcriptional LysR family regulator
MMENLSDIAVFVRVVDAGSFTGAAEALQISQPVVSKAVTRLEERLGARLLNRTTRRLSLTEAGAELYRRSLHALKQIEDAELEVARFQTEPRGTLRVNAPMSFSILHLAPVAHEFLARFPGVSLDLQLDDGFADLVEGGYDLIVRIGKLRDSNLVARRIAPARLVLCASPEYLKARGEPQAPDDLLNHNCLMYTLGSTPRAWRLVSPQGEEQMIPLRGNVATNNGLAEAALAVKGVGIALLPSFYVADELRAGRLKCVLQEWIPQDISIYAVYAERRNLTPKVRAFVDFLAAKFGPEPYWDQGLGLDTKA